MVETEVTEREVLFQALRGYLEELRETGVEELLFDRVSPKEMSPAASAPAAPPAMNHGTPAAPAPAASAAAASCSATGDPNARLLFVMSGAGYTGEAGGLLVNIIKAMGFGAEQVHLITFPLDPSGAAGVTRSELVDRISAVAPEVVVALGDAAVRVLLETSKPVSTLRGRFLEFGSMVLMPSLHPELLLANQALKRDVWNDMQQVMKRLASPSH